MCAAIAGLCTASFGVGICLMLIAMAKDIKNDMCFINKISKTHSNQSEMINKFNKFIPFHSEVTQLSEGIIRCCQFISSQNIYCNFSPLLKFC